MENIKKIAVVGGESCGKTTLVMDLAERLNTSYASEFARQYFTAHPIINYSLQTAKSIVKGQINNEKQAIRAANFYLIVDTEPITTKLWYEYLMKKSDPYLDQMVMKHKYDYYLLCDFRNIVWERDNLRRWRESREWFHKRFIDEFENLNRSYTILSGSREKRIQDAISIITNDQSSSLLEHSK